MRLLNATNQVIKAGFSGTPYVFAPYQIMSFSEQTGNWIKERETFKGLVDISYEGDGELFQEFVATKMIEGKQAFLLHLNHVIEQFMALDTELKNQNQFGTILTRKEVKNVMKQIETTTKEIKEIELKFGISIDNAEYERKSQDMFDAIESITAVFESDAEQQGKMRKQEIEQDTILKNIMGSMPGVPQ